MRAASGVFGARCGPPPGSSSWWRSGWATCLAPSVPCWSCWPLGEPLEPAELDQLADPAAVGTLERKGLITSGMDGRRVQVWLAHPVYGDVVRVGISALRERAVSRSLAEAIETVGGPRRDDTLLLASLRLAGGGGSSGLLMARARG